MAQIGFQEFLNQLTVEIRAKVLAAAKSKFEELKVSKNLPDSSCGFFVDEQKDKFTFVYDLGAIRRLYTETSSKENELPI